MNHFLSKKDKDEEIEIVELDVSFILEYLNKLVDKLPAEMMLLKFYHLNAKGTKNTTELFRTYLKRKIGVSNDTALYKVISRNRYTKTILKIKSIIDAKVYEKFGCEVTNACYVETVKADQSGVVIKIEIKR